MKYICCYAGVEAPLPWSIRMRIALGAAKGLALLHDTEKPVIYRDFKTSNILLDQVSISKILNYVISWLCLTTV